MLGGSDQSRRCEETRAKKGSAMKINERRLVRINVTPSPEDREIGAQLHKQAMP